MGAWDFGVFDDDSALDLVSELFDENNLVDFFRKTIVTSLESDYLDYDDGIAVAVCGAILDAIKNHTTYSHYFDVDSEKEGDVQFREWIESIPTYEQELLLKQSDDIKKALTLFVSNQSELYDLWSENEELFPKWKQQYLDMIKRL